MLYIINSINLECFSLSIKKCAFLEYRNYQIKKEMLMAQIKIIEFDKNILFGI